MISKSALTQCASLLLITASKTSSSSSIHAFVISPNLPTATRPAFHPATQRPSPLKAKKTRKQKEAATARRLRKSAAGLPAVKKVDRPKHVAQDAPPAARSDDDDAAAVTSRAAELVKLQKRSVQVLTAVKDSVSGLDGESVRSALSASGYCVVDNFLEDAVLTGEMEAEAASLYRSPEASSFSTVSIGSGIYASSVEGGEERYAASPRLVEYVVSLTRHLVPILNAGGGTLREGVQRNSLRVYDRAAKKSALEAIVGESVDGKKFAEVGGTAGFVSEEQKTEGVGVAVLYYMVPEGWEKWEEEEGVYHGGGKVQILGEDGKVLKSISPVRDRLVLIRGDVRHVEDGWVGQNDHALISGCFVVQFMNN